MPLPLEPDVLPLAAAPCPACGLAGWLWGAVIPADLTDLLAARAGRILLSPSGGVVDDGGIACLACGWESEAGPRPPAH